MSTAAASLETKMVTVAVVGKMEEYFSQPKVHVKQAVVFGVHMVMLVQSNRS